MITIYDMFSLPLKRQFYKMRMRYLCNCVHRVTPITGIVKHECSRVVDDRDVVRGKSENLAPYVNAPMSVM